MSDKENENLEEEKTQEQAAEQEQPVDLSTGSMTAFYIITALVLSPLP